MSPIHIAIVSACILVSSGQLLATEPVVVVSEAVVKGAKQPRVAVDKAGTIFVAFGAGQEIFICKSVDANTTYSKPIRIAQVTGLAIGMRRGPRIVIGAGWIVVTAISHQSGELLSWRSTDAGASWSEAVLVNDAKASAREGLHAMAVGVDGTIVVVWLDHRNQGAQIFGSVSHDGGLTWKPNQQIYASPSGTVCECCHPSVAIGPANEIYVMWRNSVDGSRDMYVTRSDDAGGTYSEATKLGIGSWRLNACPMDGGDLAVADDGSVTTVWRRDGTLYTSDAGRADEVRLASGEQPCLAISNDMGYIVWIERRGGTLKLAKLGSNQSTVLAKEANDPAIGVSQEASKSFVIVWETGSKAGAVILATTIVE